MTSRRTTGISLETRIKAKTIELNRYLDKWPHETIGNGKTIQDLQNELAADIEALQNLIKEYPNLRSSS